MNSIPPVKIPNIAVIDIGTNSVKLLIAEVPKDVDEIREIKFVRETTRIGEGVTSTGEINAAALLRTINAIERFNHLFRQYDCEHVFAYCTHAFRQAKNGAEAAARIEDQTSISIRILSGDDEARLAYLSARIRLAPLKPHAYLFDVGGGSVEFVHAIGGDIVTIRSLPLGALHLTERFLTTDPIDKSEIAGLRAYVKNTVSLLFDGHGLAGDRSGISPSRTDLIASGGSVTTIKNMSDLSMAYAGGATVATSKIRIGDIRRLEAKCLELPLEKRKRLPGLEPDRADIIPAGLAVVIAFMEATGKKVIKLNPRGVRDGVLIHLAKNNFQW